FGPSAPAGTHGRAAGLPGRPHAGGHDAGAGDVRHPPARGSRRDPRPLEGRGLARLRDAGGLAEPPARPRPPRRDPGARLPPARRVTAFLGEKNPGGSVGAPTRWAREAPRRRVALWPPSHRATRRG